jgi:hypothetical protein
MLINTSIYIVCVDFYNWNRVKIRYCDGGSFAGEAFDKVPKEHHHYSKVEA